jgi:tripeptidyl-peptidase-1
VSNTNTSASTEETTGFGVALLDFVAELSARPVVPHVLSMSLGSLSDASCDLLCREVSKMGFTLQECSDYMATQRQVCMFDGAEQAERINTYFMALGLRGVTVMGSSGDGGSHFSFSKFSGGAIADALNEVSCAFQIPVFPTASPYILSVGAEMWVGSSANPATWNYKNTYGSGGGFSLQFPAPAHQRAAVSGYLAKAGMPPASSFNASNRAYPDVAAVGVEGTSQSCPLTAGIFALLTDMRLNKGLPPLGFAAPRIYAVAAAHPGAAFEDITQGNSCTSCDNGFPATTGWDANTGFGRPRWEGLVAYLASD